jgi:hypothetical protein
VRREAAPLGESFDETLDARAERLGVLRRAQAGNHPFADLSGHVVGQVRLKTAADLYTPLAVVDREQQEEPAALLSRGRADAPTARDGQRVVADVAPAGRLDRRDGELDIRALLQTLERRFEPRLGLRGQHLREVVDEALRRGQGVVGDLNVGRRSGGRLRGLRGAGRGGRGLRRRRRGRRPGAARVGRPHAPLRERRQQK